VLGAVLGSAPVPELAAGTEATGVAPAAVAPAGETLSTMRTVAVLAPPDTGTVDAAAGACPAASTAPNAAASAVAPAALPAVAAVTRRHPRSR
jgi:hypothetical protein